MSDELREKVARVLANAMGEIGDDVWKFYLREADAAIALVSGEQAERIEQLEAALRAVMDDLTLIGENHWLPVGLLDDVIYVNALAALEERT